MAAAGGIFPIVRRPHAFQERTIFDGMHDNNIIERYRFSKDRIEWLVEEFGEILQRDTARNYPLSAETQLSSQGEL